MNLYIFNEHRRGALYGVGTYIKELTTALRNFEINSCVVNLISDKPQVCTEEVEGIQYWHIPSPISEPRTSDHQQQRKLYFRNIVYLLQLHIKDKANLLFHLNYHQNGSLVEELKKAFNCKIVSVAHCSDWGFTVFDNLQRLRGILKNEVPNGFDKNVRDAFEEERLYYSKVDHCICLSAYMCEIMILDYGVDSSKITVIPNGLADTVDVSDKKLLREKWNIPMEERVILFVGRIDEMKGLSYLIKAFREVLKQHADCRLVIVGSGNYDLFFREAKNISTKVTFVGFLEKDELYELYQIADLGVVPSLFEPFGYVPVEMMIHKLPIVATATSGLNEVVDDTCGLKVPLVRRCDKTEVDTGVLTENISYLLSYSEDSVQLGMNGRERYEKMYTSEIFGQNMYALYKSLIV